jgi:quercetin dioxygenase-like cupin family protein
MTATTTDRTTGTAETTTDRLWFLGNLVTVRVPRADTGGAFSVLELEGAEGDAPPPHVHDEEDETFTVLEGELELTVAGAPARLEAGRAATAPRGVPHTYRVVSPGGARWLVTTAPGRFEDFVRELSRPAERPALPPVDGPPSPEAVARLAETAARHGIRLLV